VTEQDIKKRGFYPSILDRLSIICIHQSTYRGTKVYC